MIPNISKNEYALLIVENSTGIILNKELKYELNNQNYIIFNSLDIAKEFTIQSLKIRNDIEISIFNYKSELIFQKSKENNE